MSVKLLKNTFSLLKMARNVNVPVVDEFGSNQQFTTTHLMI